MKYLINLTYYAGSDDKKDTDRGLYILTSKEKLTEEAIKKIFSEVNAKLDTYSENAEEMPLTYEAGNNIDTLVDGIRIYTGLDIEEVTENKPIQVDGFFQLEQWQ